MERGIKTVIGGSTKKKPILIWIQRRIEWEAICSYLDRDKVARWLQIVIGGPTKTNPYLDPGPNRMGNHLLLPGRWASLDPPPAWDGGRWRGAGTAAGPEHPCPATSSVIFPLKRCSGHGPFGSSPDPPIRDLELCYDPRNFVLNGPQMGLNFWRIEKEYMAVKTNWSFSCENSEKYTKF